MFLNKVMEIKLALTEKMINGFKKGSMYAIATRPGVGKTHFCISIATLFASRNQKVLYIANSISEEEFCDRQKAFEVDCGNNIFFNEIYSLNIEKLDNLASEQEFDLIILDPIEIYLLDIDLGELKEWAKKKNITVLVSKYLSRPPLESDRDHPVLSDIKFSQESLLDKFLAYIDVILFAYRKNPQSKISLTVAKNIYGTIGTTIEIDK